MKRLLSVAGLAAVVLLLGAPQRPAASRQAAASYTLTDLGVLNPGDPHAFASAINNAGQIAGFSRHPDGINLRAFRITPASVGGQQVWYQDTGGDGVNDLMQVLALPNRYAYSMGRAINAAGQIGGEANGSGFTLPQSAFFFDAGGAGQRTTTTQSHGFGINDSGVVAGNIVSMNGLLFAARWKLVKGKWTQTNLGVLAGYVQSSAHAINNADQAVGWCRDATGALQGCLFLPAPAYGLPSGVNSLGALPGHGPFIADAINNSGQVAGYSTGGATLWLPAPAYGLAAGLNNIHDPSWAGSQAYELNEAPGGLLSIVGAGGYSDGVGRAIHWNSATGLMVDLNTVTTNLPAGYFLGQALDVNDLGQIVGVASYGGASRAFVLTPE